MNMHMPQNVLAETELRHLAAIPFQIISPTNNSPLIGIYQDSLLGSFRLTRPNITMTPRDAMNLLMMFPKVNTEALREKGARISSFDVLSQILPPMTMVYKTKLFEEGDDYETSNNVLEIRNGKILRGQMEKSVLGSVTKGILHRVCNDFGNMACANFNDDLQNIVTEYMKSSSFSVGISDLIANKKTSDEIIQVITAQKLDVKLLIDKVHLGIFENTGASSNMVDFETKVNNLLNKATEQSGKIGRKSLSKDNRFLMIVESGSKGSLVNISQMISCLGQQNVDGKRIPYGFDSRTLPHYSKYDDSPNARGFIENSYISGLTAPELFFHAMGGRIGLIDTAVKSVTWETPIVIIENDRPKYIEIGKWIDAQLDDSKNAENIQHFTERQMELMNMDSVYIPTTDEDGVVTWGEITAITRHDPGTELYEIKTAGGRNVIVTESKSLLIWNPETQKLKEMLTPDIKVGDCVPVTGELCKPPIELEYIDFNYHKISLDQDTGIFVGSYLAKSDKLYLQNYKIPDGLINYLNANQNIIFPEAFIAPESFIVGLLSGYYSISSTITKDSIEIFSHSKQLLEGISMLCSRLNIYGDLCEFVSAYRFKISAQWGKIFTDKVPLLEENKQLQLNNIIWTTDFNTYNNVVLDKIVEINIIGTEAHPKVYDLTIPSTLNFGLANGLQVRDTSQTGYIQRRLIKGLEDLKVEYDMTVRNSKGKIVQFAYGDDGFDSTKTEHQIIPLVGMSIEDIYMHYDIPGINNETDVKLAIYTKGTISRMTKQRTDTMVKCKYYINKMITARDSLVENIFKFKDDNLVRLPIAFQNIIANIHGQLGLTTNSAVDITPLETFELIEEYFAKLNTIYYAKTTPLLEIMFYFYLTPRDLLAFKHFHRKGLILVLETILLKFKEALVHPGEMVGVIAGQGIGEPSTQLTLNSLIYAEEIVVRNSKKEIIRLKIGEFTENQIKLSPKIDYMKDKDTTYAELLDYYEVPCATENGETVWRRIEAVTQHPVINEDGTNTMLRVTTKGNREVTATKAKSFTQLVDGKIVGVNGKDLKVGDYLPASIKPLDYTEQFTLNLREILPPSEYLYGSELEKVKSVMHETRWWLKHANKTFTVPHSRSDSVIRLFKEIDGNIKSGSIIPGNVYMKLTNLCDYNIPENIELDYNFGYLIGAYCAEGCMTKHQISISNNDTNYFKPILELCEKWNITVKMYTHDNKNQTGWTSQDIRIYNTVLCRILENLCGKLSHNKYVSPKIVFSNRKCILGFLDAYISGDGCITKCSQSDRIAAIIISSVSRTMLTDVMVMLRNLDINGTIYKPRKQETNNRGSKDIKQIYELQIKNKQSQKLGSILNLSIKAKQQRVEQLLQQEFMYEHSKSYLTVPNIVNGELIMQDRNEAMSDLIFDQIVSIEEVPNTTNYAYDLTVEDTRTFDCYNGLCIFDTFHLSGVSSKSNVTRGVPRIEEILRLTKNPKNPSLTVHLKPIDEQDQDKATNFSNMLEHMKLINVVKSMQVCFDPNESTTFIQDDKLLLEQYYEFEKLLDDCTGQQTASGAIQKSKWIIRMEMDPEILLDKNITMDDIHFAITNSQWGNDITCVYSDYNMDKLVFRIRMNSAVFNKTKKRGAAETLDQSDEIYMLKNFQDTLLNNIVLRGIGGIKNVLARKLKNYVIKEDGKFNKKDVWVLDTTGSNLLETLAVDFIDYTRTYSNDIKEVFNVLGIEAARQIIFNELSEVMEFSDVYINYHHISLLCDRMTTNKDMVSIFRSGLLNDNVGPIAKATFEVHTEVFLNAARHADFDHMRGVSANVMCGQYGYYGTSAFSIVLDMKAMETLEDATVDTANKATEIEKMFGKTDGESETCSRSQIAIQNNIVNIKRTDGGVCNDGYDAGF